MVNLKGNPPQEQHEAFGGTELILVIFKRITKFLRRRAKSQVDGIAGNANDNDDNGNVKSYCRFHRINL
jgi:hypothetical protein